MCEIIALNKPQEEKSMGVRPGDLTFNTKIFVALSQQISFHEKVTHKIPFLNQKLFCDTKERTST
jgi:hypothetical protein